MAIINNSNIAEINKKAVIAMDKKELIAIAVKLSPAERFALIDELLRSLDRIWIDVACKLIAKAELKVFRPVM